MLFVKCGNMMLLTMAKQKNNSINIWNRNCEIQWCYFEPKEIFTELDFLFFLFCKYFIVNLFAIYQQQSKPTVVAKIIFNVISVIRRLMTLLAAQASLGASNEAALRQAASASKTAEDLLAQKDKATSVIDSKELEEALSKLKGELTEAKKGNNFCL